MELLSFLFIIIKTPSDFELNKVYAYLDTN